MHVYIYLLLFSSSIDIIQKRERMGEINHFMHKEHSLKFIEDVEAVVRVGDDNGEKKDVLHCVGCLEPISSGSAYGCIPCNCFLHNTCAKATPTINHHLDPLHPFELMHNNFEECYCGECANKVILASFVYRCIRCNRGVCFKCGVAAIAAIAFKEEALIKFQHKGHPQHTLTLQLRSAAFRCDACYTEEKDLFYQCDSCDFWIHKSCTSLAPTIVIPHHHHSLVLVYSLSDNFYNFLYFCEFCKKFITNNMWWYHCANCRYFAHIKCALNAGQTSIPSDSLGTSVDEAGVNKFLHFPMSDAFTDPLKLLHLKKVSFDDDVATEISHWSHDHPLILNVEPQGDNRSNIGCGDDPIKLCDGCIRPLSYPYYNCKDGCSFTLHKYCAELPRTLQHQLHPDHSLDLVNTGNDEYRYRCNGCFSRGNNFVYKCETCKFSLDVNCANLPYTIIHKSHKHPLFQVIDPKPRCKACNKTSTSISFSCKDCNFQLDMFCAIRSPRSLTHRYCKGHEIPLTYPPVEDHPEDFYCDICEKEMHPKRPLYHCHKCKNSFHLHCINRIDRYANVKKEGTISGSYHHKHPLTFVRRKTTCEYVCFLCNHDVNGRLMLECRTGTCPFRICYYCFLNIK